ncbi:MAG: M28 family peptidase [Acidobacteriota bacterium]
MVRIIRDAQKMPGLSVKGKMECPVGQFWSVMTRLFVLLCCVPVATAQTIQFSAVSKEIVEKRLSAYVKKNDKREPAMRQMFEDARCTGDKLAEQPVRGLKAPNLICNLSGGTELAIVVGAHFDLEEAGDGVVDNWSGASLLPSLYEGLASVPRRHTFRFIAFSGEEKGLVGSKAYVRQLGKTHEQVVAMVNMDTLGLGETEVWVSHADPKLAHLIEVAAVTMELPVLGMNVERVGTTDSESFREKKIPAITIHSLTAATMPILHSAKDRIEAIHKDEYYRTYRLVLAYLALLDQSLD